MEEKQTTSNHLRRPHSSSVHEQNERSVEIAIDAHGELEPAEPAEFASWLKNVAPLGVRHTKR